MSRLAALAGVLVLLGGLAAWTIWSSRKVEQSQPFASVKPSEAVKLILERPSEKITLENKDGTWHMTSPAADLADPEPINDILSGLTGLTVGLEVSHEESGFADYAVNEASATKVRLYSAGGAAPVLDLYFGKEALGYDSLYMRRAREKAVHLTSGLGAYRLGLAVKDFRSRRLAATLADSLQAVSLSGAVTIELRRSTNGWVSGGKYPPAERASAFVSRLVSLSVSEFVSETENAAEMDFKKPFLSIELSGTVVKEKILIGKPRKEKSGSPLYRYARASGRPAVVLIGVGEVDALIGAVK